MQSNDNPFDPSNTATTPIQVDTAVACDNSYTVHSIDPVKTITDLIVANTRDGNTFMEIVPGKVWHRNVKPRMTITVRGAEPVDINADTPEAQLDGYGDFAEFGRSRNKYPAGTKAHADYERGYLAAQVDDACEGYTTTRLEREADRN